MKKTHNRCPALPLPRCQVMPLGLRLAQGGCEGRTHTCQPGGLWQEPWELCMTKKKERDQCTTDWAQDCLSGTRPQPVWCPIQPTLRTHCSDWQVTFATQTCHLHSIACLLITGPFSFNHIRFHTAWIVRAMLLKWLEKMIKCLTVCWTWFSF